MHRGSGPCGLSTQAESGDPDFHPRGYAAEIAGRFQSALCAFYPIALNLSLRPFLIEADLDRCARG